MKKFVSLAFALIVTISLAKGQHTFHSLEEIWSYALEKNPDNAVYQLQVDKAFSDQKTTSSSLYPKINGGFSGQHNMNIAATPIPGEILGRPGEIEYVQFGLPYVYNAGITVTKTLIDWQTIYQSKIAKTNTRLKEAEKSFYEQNLKEQVAQVYYATLTAQAGVQNAEEDLLLADGKTWTSYCDAEEEMNNQAVGGIKINEYTIETEAQKNPNTHYEAKDPLTPFAIRDGRLITGQQ